MHKKLTLIFFIIVFVISVIRCSKPNTTKSNDVELSIVSSEGQYVKEMDFN